MHCEQCGARRLPTWEFCRACGADLAPEPALDPDPRLIPRLSLPRVLLSRISRTHGGAPVSSRPGMAAAVSAAVDAVRRAAHRVSRVRRSSSAASLPASPHEALPASLPRAVARPWIAGAAAALVLLVVVLIVLQLDAPPSAAQPSEERAAATVTALAAELARVREDLAASEASEQAVRAELEAEVAAAREEAAALQQELDDLRADLSGELGRVTSVRERLDEAEEQLEAYERAISEQQKEIDTLRECLGGTWIALEFARRDSWDAADRTLKAVEKPCKQAGLPF